MSDAKISLVAGQNNRERITIMRLLKVQGKGNVTMEPDIVTISFSVDVKVWDYDECLQTLNKRTEDLRQSMVASGLDKAQLKTSAFNVDVKTRYKDGETFFDGYSASHRLHIEIPQDKVLMNKVLRHVSKGHSGASIKLSFSIKDKDMLRKKVLTQAVLAAKENATTLAAASDLKLGKLMQMDYGWSEVHIYEHEDNFMCECLSAPMDYNADIDPEDVRAEDCVTLVYEILD